MSKILADFDDIVFERREKAYGSYQMRKKKDRSLASAILISCMLFLTLVGGTFFPKMLFGSEPGGEIVVPTEVITLPVTEIIDIEPQPEPEPVIPIEKKVNKPIIDMRKFEIPEPKPDEQVLDTATITEIEKFDSTAIGAQDQEGDGEGQQAYNWEDIDTNSTYTEILDGDKGEGDPRHDEWISVDEEPRPINLDDITKQIGYPPMAKEAGIEGRVVVRILVDATGKYKKHVILNDGQAHQLLERAVEKKLSLLTFTPGIAAGQPRSVWVTIPFKFALNR